MLLTINYNDLAVAGGSKGILQLTGDLHPFLAGGSQLIQHVGKLLRVGPRGRQGAVQQDLPLDGRQGVRDYRLAGDCQGGSLKQ